MWSSSIGILAVLGIGSLNFCVTTDPHGKDDDGLNNHLFSRIDTKATELTPRQQRVLGRILSRRANRAYEVVKVETSEIDSLAQLTIPLPKKSSLSIANVKVVDDKENGVKQISGRSSDGEDSVALAITGDTVTGLLYHGKKSYAVEPLGDGLHAIVEVDQTKFGPDEPPGPQAEIERKRN